MSICPPCLCAVEGPPCHTLYPSQAGLLCGQVVHSPSTPTLAYSRPVAALLTLAHQTALGGRVGCSKIEFNAYTGSSQVWCCNGALSREPRYWD